MPPDEHDSSGMFWHAIDGIDILGAPYGSPEFVEKYLHKKLRKHEQPLDFITFVAKMEYSKEAHKMLTGSAGT
jgi:hypothetical protein